MCRGNLEFSALSAGDVADIGSLCQGCVYWELPEEFDQGPSPQQMRRLKEEWLAAHTTSRVVGQIAREQGRAVGFIQFGPPELYPQQASYRSGPICPDAILITCLFVKPEFRRQGLAHRLLALAEAEARQADYSAIETFARRGSSENPSGPIELYLRCGFGVKRDDDEFPLLRKAVPAGHGSPETSDDGGE
ncbi:MAG TPA: GNAT family N-acetyltransferase [Anaerolineae bacterium]|nr:GNAT family N-acetyltransferase [Anaerolineae bacterium]